MARVKVGTALAVILLFSSISAGAEYLILHFSPDIRIGSVELNKDTRETWRWSEQDRWLSVGAAIGDVMVPAGRQIAIKLDENIADNLAGLAQLANMPIHTILIEADPDPLKIVENLPPMPQLKGLAYLWSGQGIPIASLDKFPNLETMSGFLFETDADAQSLTGMKGLRRLGARLPHDNLWPLEKLDHLEAVALDIGNDSDLTPLTKLQHLEELHLSCQNFNVAALAKIAEMKHLTRLVLSGSGLRPEAYAFIAACGNLKHLGLLEVYPTPADFAALSASTNLESLEMTDRQLEDAHLAEISKIRSLKKLVLGASPYVENVDPKITDAGVAQLGSLTNLEQLVLTYGSMGASGGKALAALPRLQRLHLPCGVSDDALFALAESKSLRVLRLCHGITKDGIEAIKRFRSLKNLQHGGKQSKDLNEALWTALPELVVQNEGPDLSPAGREIWNAFRNSLCDRQWEKALSYCTDDVKKEAGESASLEEFFSKTVPVAKIMADLAELPKNHSMYDEKLDAVYNRYYVKFQELHPVISPHWQWSIRQADNTWQIDFNPIPLQFLIDKAAEEARRWEKEEEQARQVFKGVSIKLTSSKTTYEVGEPVLFRLDLLNDGAYWVYCDSQGIHHGGLDVVNQNGERSKYLKPSIQTGGAEKPLAPGKSDCIYENRDVAEWYDLSQPGRYTIGLSKYTLSIYADPSGNPADVDYDANGKPVSVAVPKKTIRAPMDLGPNSVTIEIVPKGGSQQ